MDLAAYFDDYRVAIRQLPKEPEIFCVVDTALPGKHELHIAGVARGILDVNENRVAQKGPSRLLQLVAAQLVVAVIIDQLDPRAADLLEQPARALGRVQRPSDMGL